MPLWQLIADADGRAGGGRPLHMCNQIPYRFLNLLSLTPLAL